MSVTAVVEWGQIFEVIWASLAAGIGVTALFSGVIFGYSRAAEARRSGTASSRYATLALVSLIGFAAVCVFGVTLILRKS